MELQPVQHIFLVQQAHNLIVEHHRNLVQLPSLQMIECLGNVLIGRHKFEV
jgi:hypothetical protein